jgi:hypothetical protein
LSRRCLLSDFLYFRVCVLIRKSCLYGAEAPLSLYPMLCLSQLRTLPLVCSLPSIPGGRSGYQQLFQLLVPCPGLLHEEVELLQLVSAHSGVSGTIRPTSRIHSTMAADRRPSVACSRSFLPGSCFILLVPAFCCPLIVGSHYAGGLLHHHQGRLSGSRCTLDWELCPFPPQCLSNASVCCSRTFTLAPRVQRLLRPLLPLMPHPLSS